jgi:hypothetical protein
MNTDERGWEGMAGMKGAGGTSELCIYLCSSAFIIASLFLAFPGPSATARYWSSPYSLILR